MTKEELEKIEENINYILDTFVIAQKNGQNKKAHEIVDIITHEMNKLKTEEEQQQGKTIYVH